MVLGPVNAFNTTTSSALMLLALAHVIQWYPPKDMDLP